MSGIGRDVCVHTREMLNAHMLEETGSIILWPLSEMSRRRNCALRDGSLRGSGGGMSGRGSKNELPDDGRPRLFQRFYTHTHTRTRVHKSIIAGGRGRSMREEGKLPLDPFRSRIEREILLSRVFQNFIARPIVRAANNGERVAIRKGFPIPYVYYIYIYSQHPSAQRI